LTTGRAPLLVLVAGNPSRGDDALGPLLAARLEAAGLPQVEVLCDFQWQVENALDLEGRELVVFVDAGIETPAPFELREVSPGGRMLHTSHTLAPEAVLATFVQVTGKAAPPALLLCVRGAAGAPALRARRVLRARRARVAGGAGASGVGLGPAAAVVRK